MQKKRVLLIGYSQTGQLKTIAQSVAKPLKEGGVDLCELWLEPTQPYPFPWPPRQFFDVFPESVYLDPAPIQEPAIDENAFDLIILAYQPWFLSPSGPITAFMKSEIAKKVLNGKPVITLIGCRNMWIMAEADMRKLIAQAGGIHTDTAVLIDQSGPLESFITTPRWLLTGKKEAFWGLSAAGVNRNDIQNASRFGRALLWALNQPTLPSGPLLWGLEACKVDVRLARSERIGKRSFRIWGALIRLLGKPGSWARRPVLLLYLIFLITMIATVVPLSMALQALVNPFVKKGLERQRKTLEAPSGSGGERMNEFLPKESQ